MPPRHTATATLLAALGAALCACTRAIPALDPLAAVIRIEDHRALAPCALTGPDPDADRNGPTIIFPGAAYSDANLACIADVSLEHGWDVMFRTPALYERFSRIEMQRPHMLRSIAEQRDRARERLRQSGHLARLPPYTRGDDLAALAPRIETLCGFARGEVLQPSGDHLIMGAVPPRDPRTACLFDTLQVLDVEFTNTLVLQGGAGSAE